MTKQQPARKYTSSEISRLIAARYPTNEYATFFDVANATGSGVDRRADAITINLWPSRGLELEGFEIKVDRRDWLRELNNPAKADPICRFCHRWWIVAPEGVVLDGELPKTWGLLVPVRDKLKAVTAAPKLEPEPPTLSFFASLCRSAQAQLSDNAKLDAARREGRAEARQAGYAEGKRDGQWDEEQKRKRLERELEDLRARVAEFEAESGVNLVEYRGVGGGYIGRAVRFVLDGNLEHLATKVRGVRGQFATELAHLDRMVESVAAILAEQPKQATSAESTGGARE